jgi:hydroxymethylpyrimidine/phosphomethylpyrimidine kinase
MGFLPTWAPERATSSLTAPKLGQMAHSESVSAGSGGGRARPPCVLSIAGSDSGGGAGIQADLKAFAACGVHGMTAITAITAQSTVGVSAVQAISPEVIVAQVRAVAEDIGVDAVKIGMLGTAATIRAVAASLDLLAPGTPVVLDPVMVSESGAELLEPSARGALLELLLPRVLVITPNLPEARALAGAVGPSAAAAPAPAATGGAPAPANGDDAAALARALRALGPEIVVVTGGHREEAVDVFFDGSEVVELPGERYPGGAAHGSGCTHSSVLAARLAWGDAPLEAARVAKRLASRAVRDGLAGVGAGAGPVNVLGALRH